MAYVWPAPKPLRVVSERSQKVCQNVAEGILRTLRSKRIVYNDTHLKILMGSERDPVIQQDMEGFCALAACAAYKQLSRALSAERVEIVESKEHMHCYALVNGYLIVDPTAAQFGGRKAPLVFSAMDFDFSKLPLVAYYGKGRTFRTIAEAQAAMCGDPSVPKHWPLNQQPSDFNLELAGVK